MLYNEMAFKFIELKTIQTIHHTLLPDDAVRKTSSLQGKQFRSWIVACRKRFCIRIYCAVSLSITSPNISVSVAVTVKILNLRYYTISSYKPPLQLPGMTGSTSIQQELNQCVTCRFKPIKHRSWKYRL